MDGTGSATLGGDWDLEYATGMIETGVVFGTDVQSNWSHLMVLQTVRDNFSVKSYGNNDGSAVWVGMWMENDTAGGGASNGNIKIETNSGLKMKTRTATESIYRQVDLSTAVYATLTYDVDSSLSGGEAVRVEVSGDGGASWTTLMDYTSPVITSENFDISSFMAADTQIRFSSLTGGNDTIVFDNIQIEFDDTQAPGGVDTNLNLWLRADAGVSTSTSRVDQWDNQVTASSLTDVTAGGSSRPLLNASALNFNPVISFDGLNDNLRNSSVVGSELFASDAGSTFTVAV